VEHDFVFLENGVNRVSSGHVVADVQTASVSVPAFKPNPITEKAEKLLEAWTRKVVREKL
jgi:hypothetical protein